MENRGYQPEEMHEVPAYGVDDPPPYSPTPQPPQQPFSLVRDEMETLRAQLEPGVFNAVLDHGDMTNFDVFKLIFLIAFPTIFFILSIIIMAADD